MQPPKSNQSVTERTLLNSNMMHGGKNVQNADKFEKFELLKERFKNYRENVLKIGFDNLLKTHPAIASSCTNVNNPNNMTGSHMNLSDNSSPTASLNQQNNLHKQTCCCSYCAYCTQQQTILTEIAYLNNLEHDIKEIRDYLRDTRKKLESKEMKVKLAQDWKQTALVLDRTFFFIYLFITISTLIVMFPTELNMVNKSAKSQEMTTPMPITTSLDDVVNMATTAVADTLKKYQEKNSSGFLFL